VKIFRNPGLHFMEKRPSEKFMETETVRIRGRVRVRVRVWVWGEGED